MSGKSDRGTKRPKLRKPVGDPKHHPCGCIEQSHDDDTVNIIECPAHGLLTAATALAEAAEALGKVSNALGSVGRSLYNDGVQSRANDAVDEGIKDGTIK